MPKFYLILMLLVATFTVTAHGRILQANRHVMTSLPDQEVDAVSQIYENNLKLDKIVTKQTPSSAVQDWSLVCQQLYGAALGGAVCAPFCKNLTNFPYSVQLVNAAGIIDSKKDLICPELCGLQLGDDVCTCKNYITRLHKHQTNVCAIMCDYVSVTLTGCTPCNWNTKNRNMFLRSSENLIATEIVTKLTTPNWNELCATLCKTGDGGSLCNCDLSPFRTRAL